MQRDILPRMQRLIRRIFDDERRRMASGTFTCRRHVAADAFAEEDREVLTATR